MNMPNIYIYDMRFCDNCENLLKIVVRSDGETNMVCVVCSLSHETNKGDTLVKPQDKPNEADIIGHKVAYMDKLNYVRKINEKCRTEKCDGEILSCILLDNVRYIYKCDKCGDSYTANN